MPLSDIVNVSITRATRSVSKVGFGTLMILDSHFKFDSAEPIKFYDDIDAVAEDFASTDYAYIAANSAFSQNPRPTRVAIGNRAHNGVILDVTTNTIGATYTIEFYGGEDGEFYTVTATGLATEILTAGAIKTAIDSETGLTDWVEVTDNGDGTLDIDKDVGDDSNTGFCIYADSKMTLTHGSATYTNVDPENAAGKAEGVEDALSLIQSYTDTLGSAYDWYWVTLTSRYANDQGALADWCESRQKVGGVASADANTLDSLDTTSVAYLLNNQAHARTFVMYHDDVDSGAAHINATSTDPFPEAAWIGKMVALADPDVEAATWKFKTLAGVETVALTATEKAAALAFECNVYTEIGGVNITEEGVVAEGEYIDVILAVDWLQARITEEVYGKLVNAKKIPFTSLGIGVIEAAVRAVMARGIMIGHLAMDTDSWGEFGYSVTVPAIADISSTDKANRELGSVKFNATVAGAIHKVTITGIVSV